MNKDGIAHRHSLGRQKVALQDHRSRAEIEQLLPEVVGKSDEELRELKKRLIDTFDYKKSCLVQQYLNLAKTDNTDRVVASFEAQLRSDAAAALAAFEAGRAAALRAAREFEVRLRRELEESFAQMAQRHVDELARIEVVRELESARAVRRVSPEVSALWSRSKRLATKDDYAGAVAAKALGDQQHADECAQRRAAAAERCDRATRQALQRQRAEIEHMQARLAQLLDEAEGVHAREQQLLQKKVGIALHCALQHAAMEAAKQLTDQKMRAKLGRGLAQCLEKVLRESGHEELIAFRESQ